MANYLRNNIWNNGGNFNNLDLLWYAKGVGAMMERSINNPTSWWFYAAIHGEYVSSGNVIKPSAFPNWTFITSPPTVLTKPLPSKKTIKMYWNQCQHGSWYFLPWHRGYLMALESQLRQDIIKLGGPKSWALPYWNYFGGTKGSQYQMPPAFGQKTLPDGSANPLYIAMRYGPDGNGTIYIPTAAGIAAHPGHPNFPYGEVTADALTNDLFTGTDVATPLPGFGGPDTGFSHPGSTPHGNLESNPHDLVHVYVGNAPSSSSSIYGLMADPGTAGLDPIFYIHHCNIDRMWAIWNAKGNNNPTNPSWLDGPAHRFVMPDTNGKPWYYTPAQVANLSVLDYSYQELSAPPAPATPTFAQRLEMLGAPPAVTSRPPAQTVPKQPQLLGASAGRLDINGNGAQSLIKLDTSERSRTVESFTGISENSLPDKAFLKLENVRGTFDATVLTIYVQAPEDGKPVQGSRLLAGSVALFGLRRASAPDGQHGGEGLTFILDITPIIDQLHLDNALNADSLQIDIVPNRPLLDKTEIQVGRISIYRQAF